MLFIPEDSLLIPVSSNCSTEDWSQFSFNVGSTNGVFFFLQKNDLTVFLIAPNIARALFTKPFPHILTQIGFTMTRRTRQELRSVSTCRTGTYIGIYWTQRILTVVLKKGGAAKNVTWLFKSQWERIVQTIAGSLQPVALVLRSLASSSSCNGWRTFWKGEERQARCHLTFQSRLERIVQI